MDPHVVRSLKDFEVSEVRGGQHHALALTQVPLLLAFMLGFGLSVGFNKVWSCLNAPLHTKAGFQDPSHICFVHVLLGCVVDTYGKKLV